MGGLTWDWIVCDEGHKLKNPAAQLSQKQGCVYNADHVISTFETLVS